MLIGEFRCRVDREGRLVIPSELQPELADGLTVTRGIERCLVVYPAATWRRLAERIDDQLPLTSSVARAFNRLVFSGASACVPGERGQMKLPASLKAYASIQDEVVVVGLFSHLEIWNPEGWRETRLASLQDGTGLAEKLSKFGI